MKIGHVHWFQTEQSENRSITQSSVQRTRGKQEYLKYKPCATDYVSILSLCELFADKMFLNAGLEQSRSNPINPIFEMHKNLFWGRAISRNNSPPPPMDDIGNPAWTWLELH